MPAYIISMMSIKDTEEYRKYTDRTPPIVKKHGGKFLARGGEVLTLEGESYTDRMVLMEFPSKQSVLDWMNDPDYQEAVVFRHASSEANIYVLVGSEDTEAPNPQLECVKSTSEKNHDKK